MTKPKTPDNTVTAPEPAREPALEFSRQRIELLKRTIARGATDDEMALFKAICEQSGLNPFARQIYMVKRWDSREKREIMTTQTSIDGFRLIADRTGKYEGQTAPVWCGPDGQWRDVWIPDDPPVAAMVGVFKTGCREPFKSIAKFTEYVQADRDGQPVSMWRKMPANQLAKCAEALSLRKAFPQELSGLYTADEMGQADRDGSSSDTVIIPPPEAPPQAPQQSTVRPWSNFKEMIAAFAKLHGRLPPEHDHIYTDTLRVFGVEHSNEFRDSGTALAAYYKLREKVMRILAEGATVDANTEKPEAVPEAEAQS